MKKFVKILVPTVLIIFAIYFLSWQFDFSKGDEILGVTFSQYYAEEILKLDWRRTYQEILDDLNPKKLRLIAYWQYLEPERGVFNFEDLDWQIEEAQKRNREVVLVIGRRVPRWPECHVPEWAKNLNNEDFKKTLLDYLSVLVNHYKSFETVRVWQVENEPFLKTFGICSSLNGKFLKKEITLVKTLDPRPIMVTDSGELSLWIRASRISDIFGTTFYKIVWNKYTGWFEQFYPPVFYALRGELVKTMTQTKKIIISELQAEPWTADGKTITNVAFEEQIKHFNLGQLRENIKLARKTGIKEIYLWGSEWWYYRKINGDSGYWTLIKEELLKQK